MSELSERFTRNRLDPDGQPALVESTCTLCGAAFKADLFNLAEREKSHTASCIKRILCISYDESLLLTRKMILEQAGYDVTAAFGFAEAMEHCSADPTFDLIVMGHSMPRKDKTTLIGALRTICKAPVLSVPRHGDPPLPEADASVDSMDGPVKLVEAVKAAISTASKSASAK